MECQNNNWACICSQDSQENIHFVFYTKIAVFPQAKSVSRFEFLDVITIKTNYQLKLFNIENNWI